MRFTWVAVVVALLAVGAARADDTASVQNMLDAQSVVTLPAGKYYVTTLTLHENNILAGEGADPNGHGGTQIVGTPGDNTITFENSDGYSPYSIRDLRITGGLNAIASPTGNLTHLTLKDLVLGGSNAAIQINGPDEEWYASNLYMVGGTYCIQQQGHSYLMKSSFTNWQCSGTSSNGLQLANDNSAGNIDATVTFRDGICNWVGGSCVYLAAPAWNLSFDGLNSEEDGRNGTVNDIEFAGLPGYQQDILFNHVYLGGNGSAGNHIQYSIDKAPHGSVLMGSIIPSNAPVYDPSNNLAVIGGNVAVVH